MNIIKTPAYQTEDGTTHASIEAAQTHALGLLVATAPITGSVADFILSNKDTIISVLTSTGRRPRRKNKTPKAKAVKAEPISTKAPTP
jgi:hypothetical protein